jgi:hypothetical protein
MTAPTTFYNLTIDNGVTVAMQRGAGDFAVTNDGNFGGASASTITLSANVRVRMNRTGATEPATIGAGVT